MIEIKDLKKSYMLDKGNIIHALFGVDLSIRQGESVAIIGKSGSGKSTLMNIITCIESIEEGSYYFNGEDIRSKSRKQLADFRNSHFGFVYQSFNLLSNLNAYENIELPLIYKGMKKEERRKRIEEIALKVQIEQRLKHKPNEMSGGEKQRVAIARALVVDPLIIIADEPTGALDEYTGNEIMRLLENLNKEGKTLIIVTHDLDIASRCKRQITLSDGKVIKDNRGEC